MTRALAFILLALLSGCGLQQSHSNSPDLTTYNANDGVQVSAITDADKAWIGDSYVALGAWDAWFPGSDNWGHGGDTTGAILARMPLSVPATAYLWCGANDINGNVPRNVTLANYGAIIDALHAAGAQHVICLSVLPYARQFPLVFDIGYNPTVTNVLDQQLQVVALDHGASWIDLRPAIADPDGWCDAGYSEPAGIHLNQGGYARILTILRPSG